MQAEGLTLTKNETMNTQAPDIKTLIPQADPFVMVGEVVEVAGKGIVTSTLIGADNLLVHEGRFTAYGLLENIAQSAAALSGYEAMSRQAPVRRGFIGAVKNFKVGALPLVGSRIETHVAVVDKVFNVDIIRGEVLQNGQSLAECEMKIFLEED